MQAQTGFVLLFICAEYKENKFKCDSKFVRHPHRRIPQFKDTFNVFPIQWIKTAAIKSKIKTAFRKFFHYLYFFCKYIMNFYFKKFKIYIYTGSSLSRVKASIILLLEEKKSRGSQKIWTRDRNFLPFFHLLIKASFTKLFKIIIFQS